MATTAQWYGQSPTGLIAAMWQARTMKVALMKPTFTPDRDAQLRYSDISGQEVASGSGYTTGGATITGKATSYDAAADEYNLQGADVSWGPGATFQARYGVIYESDSVDKWLWALLDFGALQDISNGTFLLDWALNMLGVQAGPAV